MKFCLKCRKKKNTLFGKFALMIPLFIFLLGNSLSAQIDSLAVSPDTILCTGGEFNIQTFVFDGDIPVEEAGLGIRIRNNPFNNPLLTGSGSSTSQGFTAFSQIFTVPGKDSVFVSAIDPNDPNVILRDTICVTVLDVGDPPVAIAKDALCLYLDENGMATLSPEDIDNGSAGCGPITLTINQSSFDCSDIGLPRPLVTLRISDQNQFGTSDVTEITVKDTLAPTITCNTDVIKAPLDTMGRVIIDSTFLVNNGFSFADNCENFTVRLGTGRFLSLRPECDRLDDTLTRRVYVMDASGNESTCSFRVHIVDKIAPILSCPPLDTIFLDLNPNGLDTFVISEFEVNGMPGFSIVDNCPGAYFAPDSLFYSCENIGAWRQVFTVRDSSNNESSCSRVIAVRDVTAPVIDIKKRDTVYLDIEGKGILTAAALDIDTRDSCSTVDIAVSRGVFDCAEVDTFPIIQFIAKDIFDNADTCDVRITVLDTIAPILFCKDSVIAFLDSMGSVTLAKTAFIDRVKEACTVTDTLVERLTFGCADLNIPDTIKVTVIDFSGNRDSCLVPVIIKDRIFPEITCMNYTGLLGADGYVDIDPLQIIDNSNSRDNCGLGNLTLSLSQERFFCSNIGTQTVTLFATDEFGNTSECDASVTIIDNNGPSASCKNITVQVSDGQPVVITAADVFDSSIENCGVTTMSIDRNTFTCADIGQVVTVQLTITDNSGNISRCDAHVTVEGTLAPIANCYPDVAVYLDADGNASVTLEEVNKASEVSCQPPALELLDARTYDCADLRNNSIMVRLVAMDANGNTDTCKSRIIVLDTIAPKAICASNVTNLELNPVNLTATINANFLDQGSTDNCGIDSMYVSPSRFTCDDVGLNTVTLFVRDSSGNIGSCTRVINVVNTQAVDLVCRNITVSLGVDGQVTVDPNDVVNMTASNCVGNIPLVLSKSVFTCDDLGDNTVILGLESTEYPNTCEAIITVVDDLVPKIEVRKAYTAKLNAWGIATVCIEDILISTSDNCAIMDTTLNADILIDGKAQFECNDIFSSPREVSITVRDSSGNDTTCISMITIVDEIAPVLVGDCGRDTVLQPIKDCRASYTFPIPEFIDNCSIDTIIVSSSDQTVDLVRNITGDSITGVFELATTITFTAIDQSNQSTSCSFTIAVEDSEDPTFGNTCPEDIIIYIGDDCTIEYTPSNILPQDNCGINTYTCSFRYLPDGGVRTINTNGDVTPLELPVGATFFSHVVTDFTGLNTAECSYTVTVVDTVSPTLAFNDSFAGVPLSGFSNGDTLTITPPDTVPLFNTMQVDANDNCGISEVTFLDEGIFNNGCLTRGYDRLFRCVWTATDLSGNTSEIVLFIKVACEDEATRPDLTPRIIANPTGLIRNVTTPFIVEINNIDGPTNGLVNFAILKSAGFEYNFSPSTTTANVRFRNYAVNNSDWTVVEAANVFIFSSNTPIPSGGASRIAIDITGLAAGASGGINVTAQTASETRTDNNRAIQAQSVQN